MERKVKIDIHELAVKFKFVNGSGLGLHRAAPGYYETVGRWFCNEVDAPPIEDVPINPWIPIEHQKPPQYREVLVRVAYQRGVQPKTHIAWLDDIGWASGTFGRLSGDVTHWMPLPDPPNNANGADGPSGVFAQGSLFNQS